MPKMKCSFCQRPASEVQQVISGANPEQICDECVGVCTWILREARGANERPSFTVMPSRRNWLQRVLAPK